MSIKTELEKLKEQDIWSLMLFVLCKVKDIPEYSGISELSYILDKKNLLRLCEYFGGCTITIPTIEELETIIYALLLYQHVNVEHMIFEEAVALIEKNDVDIRSIKACYHMLTDVLNSYDITPRART